MSHEQIKGTFLAVGATATSTALLVGGIATYNHAQSTAAADEQAVIFNEAHSASGATDALTGAAGVSAFERAGAVLGCVVLLTGAGFGFSGTFTVLASSP